MKLLLIASVFVASAAGAQTGYGVKLIVTYSPGGLLIVDYPNHERCERARLALVADAEKRKVEAKDNAPQGAVLVGGPFVLRGVCVPG